MRALIVVAALADVMPCGTHHRPPEPPTPSVNRSTPEGVIEAIGWAARNGVTEALPRLCQGAKVALTRTAVEICETTPEVSAWSAFRIGWSEAYPLGVKIDGARATVDLAFGKGAAERRVLTLVQAGGDWFVEELK